MTKSKSHKLSELSFSHLKYKFYPNTEVEKILFIGTEQKDFSFRFIKINIMLDLSL